ncbi:ATP-binding protein [Dolichospermum sp. ST_con]|nr:ATP-binding protein [Dolichospermum sp. ST_con]MDD1420828.1 ATP-binding protein [Dolichospermum sp. ST_sed1]MDD1426421.1 ATP-binding protein [Dolichospermum sp. ST_sed9]MDD1433076.1 ATP-binding protein [Dolichospermum sp. ST_sed6]MDD1438015.1 ATP-binding protein [Dolichospermum sp. ST_sed10]MDD1442700.1 ATP-binding protein [Dolichospermum sp. ST_sed3]MDD1448096.1 ATP-binding protein [Dolichospermum sp. ST_sed8]MDD1456857.1 ATP-binding protein [Dolichospermum sp. ST_sed7]MDD1462637.1 ATP-
MLAMHSIQNVDQLNLKLESTLQELPVWTIQLEIDYPGNDLTRLFEEEPLLPGIILTKDKKYLGVISRRLFFEQMSRPYGLGLFAGRPIEYLYNFLQPNILVFPEDTLIVEATQIALGRSHKQVYETIVITDQSYQYGLLDFHQLLLANSQIHVLTLNRLQKEKEKARAARADFRDLQDNYSRLLQNDKMIALGQLVAGIAHEINNPMNFIYGNLNYAIEYVQDILFMIECYQQEKPYSDVLFEAKEKGIEIEFIMEDLPKLLSSMKVGATRVNEIVLSLRNFSRLDQAKIKAVDIHEGIENTLIILKHNLKAKPDRLEIELIKEYDNLPLIDCYAGQLNQVFMNIIANAIDALSESNNLILKTRKKLQIRIRTELTNDNYVIIRIADNGSGIPEEVQKRLFDPFFTTKAVGKGTGLGLSISYQIVVEQHGGELHCISTPEEGSEFIIKIPVVSNHSEEIPQNLKVSSLTNSVTS